MYQAGHWWGCYWVVRTFWFYQGERVRDVADSIGLLETLPEVQQKRHRLIQSTSIEILLHDTTRHNTTRHGTALHYTTLHYTTLHYTTLHYTTLHYTTLHYTTLQCHATERNATQHNATQYNTKNCNHTNTKELHSSPRAVMRYMTGSCCIVFYSILKAVSCHCRKYPSARVIQLSLSFAVLVHTTPCCPTMSPLQRRYGLPADLTPFIFHSVLLIVHLLSFIRAMCPVHFHFLLVSFWTMSVTLVLCQILVLRILSFSLTLIISLSMVHWLVSSFFTNTLVRDHVWHPYVIAGKTH